MSRNVSKKTFGWYAMMYWVGQKVNSGFSTRWHRRTQVNVFASPIYTRPFLEMLLPLLLFNLMLLSSKFTRILMAVRKWIWVL